MASGPGIRKVMISSTAIDLPDHRAKAFDACHRQVMQPIGMEHLGARDASAVAVSMAMVDEADIYVGIYAWRYGWVPDGSAISITEMEFDRAVKRGIPILVFLIHEHHDITRPMVETEDGAPQKLAAFKKRACEKRIRAEFTSPDNLNALIIHALGEYKNQPSPATSISILHQLLSPPELTGRDDDLRELENALTDNHATGATIVGSYAVQGSGGIGKTALATVLANKLKNRYPEAQLFLNLRGAGADEGGYRAGAVKPITPVEAMQIIIHAFHPTAQLPETVEQLAPIYRSILTDAGRVLLLLDNAADSAQVKPLLPPPNCLLLVTSRELFHIAGLAVRCLDYLHPAKSCELLLKLAPRIRGLESEAARLCGHLPLALEVFAGAVNDKHLTPVNELVERLRAGTERLAPVDAAFQVSYDLLGGELRRKWTSLAIFTAAFDLRAAAAIWEMEPDAARGEMQALVNASLVEWSEATGRFRLHDLVRQFCLCRLSEGNRSAALLLHAGHYRDVCREANELYKQGGENVLLGLALFDRERTHIEAAFDWLQLRRDIESSPLLVSLVHAVVYTGDMRFHPRQRIRWVEAQRDAARVTNDRFSEGAALHNLGDAYIALGNVRKSIELYDEALIIGREIGDRSLEGCALTGLGLAYAPSDARKAIEFYDRALVIDREIGDRRGEGADLCHLGLAYAANGEAGKAIEYYEQALVIVREIGHRRNEGAVVGNLGNAYGKFGDARKAIEFYERQLIIAREIGDRYGEGNALWNSAVEFDKLHYREQAVSRAEAALKIYEEIESPASAKVRATLAKWRGE